ncbi:exodeoxyribonuclease III [Nocardia gamkensis]|uniref:Exodeoxyribonuclease III n=1 Tax=Nocardia gamkensis TaxID=352869 RepID=A0A7X6L7L3_9NOCA|nr:exodeoxyribonuclease III [Nocardia gamkensis]NKY29280.1 exodeoxyribonuclease III [Nocardia gamkensis]NQE67123.1 DNA-(apurinic or apyrimidinic site) lyase [Nocardia gamkensis]
MPYISTVNVNGVRAAAGKGLLAWLAATEADVVCVQETRATDEQVRAALAPALDAGWQLSHAEPESKGRAGVGILSRRTPRAVRVGFGSSEFAAAGRYLEADFDDVTVASVYVHSGDAGTVRQDEKYRFMAELGAYLTARTGDFVVAGDWNIAHTERDLKNWKGNLKSAGFLPQERAWIDELLAAGYVDVVRHLHPGVDGPYSWWSYRGRAFDNDTGWRIDAVYTTADIASRAVSARVERAATYAERWSDHAPVTVEFAEKAYEPVVIPAPTGAVPGAETVCVQPG